MKTMHVDGIKLIPETIEYMVGMGNYTHIVFVDGVKVIYSKSLGLLTDNLRLTRIHKGAAVNARYVAEIDFLERIIMRSGVVLEVSRRRKKEVLKTVLNKLTESVIF